MATNEEALNTLLQTTAVGDIGSALSDSYFGINHRRTPGAVQINKETFGLTFFTRPMMNMSTANLSTRRQMIQLLSDNENSISRIIRCTLDHRLASPSTIGESVDRPMEPIRCPLVDELQAFIPLLTNNLLSMSGWPDVVAPTYGSTAGVYKEEFGHIDGITTNYSAYDITANFANIPGDPITSLFLTWANYGSHVAEGIMVPYPDMLIENKIDYMTRIYRLCLDETNTIVTKIAACGAGFPLSSPIGAAFNFESEKPYNSANDQISIPFRCYGAQYMDPILYDEFNRTVETFNTGMSNRYRGYMYQKVPHGLLGIFNNRGYPRINLDTLELEWYVSQELFASRMPAIEMFSQRA